MNVEGSINSLKTSTLIIGSINEHFPAYLE